MLVLGSLIILHKVLNKLVFIFYPYFFQIRTPIRKTRSKPTTIERSLFVLVRILERKIINTIFLTSSNEIFVAYVQSSNKSVALRKKKKIKKTYFQKTKNERAKINANCFPRSNNNYMHLHLVFIFLKKSPNFFSPFPF